MDRYEAVLFDFDGVLVDSEPVHYECWQEIIGPYGINLDWETYCREGIGVSDRAMLAMLCRQVDPPVDIELLVAEYPRKKDMFRARMLACSPISAEVAGLLADLHDRGLRTAVVTSSGQNEVEPILEAAGIRQRFHAAVFGGDVERLKPAPDPYLLAMERLGVTRALVVEDSEAGVASGKAAGLDVVQVDRQSRMIELVRAHLDI